VERLEREARAASPESSHFVLLDWLVNRRTADAGSVAGVHLIGFTSFKLIRSALRYL
jgi:hypothetical protein